VAYRQGVVVLITVVAVLVSAGLAIWFGNHSLRSQDGSSSAGVGNAFGGFDVFDPGQGRMKDELDSKETEGEMFAAPEEDDRPIRVDLRSNTIHIRKPQPPVPPTD
jgi:hypothetical protein